MYGENQQYSCGVAGLPLEYDSNLGKSGGPLRVELVEEQVIISRTEEVTVRKHSWKREARQRGRDRGGEVSVLSSILGKRDEERVAQTNVTLMAHVNKKLKDREAVEMEIGTTNALSVEAALEQLRRAQ